MLRRAKAQLPNVLVEVDVAVSALGFTRDAIEDELRRLHEGESISADILGFIQQLEVPAHDESVIISVLQGLREQPLSQVLDWHRQYGIRRIGQTTREMIELVVKD